MMFQAEMENLELDLNLGSSDLLFVDDLLNVPLEAFQRGSNFDFGDDDRWNEEEETKKLEDDDDILEKIIKEVRLPRGEHLQQSYSPSNIWADDPALFDEVQPSPSASSCCSVSSGEDSTQTLIDEMEEFLVRHEVRQTISDDEDMVESPLPPTKPDTPLSPAEAKEAEELLEALITGKISMDDSGYAGDLSINNISEITTDDGSKIVIVITNDVKMEEEDYVLSSLPSPSHSNASSTMASSLAEDFEDTSDTDWSPGSPPTKTTSAAAKKRERKGSDPRRGPYKRSALGHVKDKKERKKLQNVVAARRYRDKKKSEQSTVEQEEQELLDQNTRLKVQLRDIESEVKTLKKLMLELGLVKMGSKK
jgi:hypothetical protein